MQWLLSQLLSKRAGLDANMELPAGQTWAQKNVHLPPLHMGLRLIPQDREEERQSELRMLLVGRSEIGRHCLPCGVMWQECGHGTVRAEPPSQHHPGPCRAWTGSMPP